MAVHRTAPLDERELFGEYPFLPGAESLVEELSPSLKDVLTDPSYDRARELGRARVLAAVDDPTGSSALEELARATREERFLSFLYARLLLSASPGAAPLRRWAVAEAKRSWARLDTAPAAELVEVARRMGHEFDSVGMEVGLRLADYLRLATAIREGDFRLVRQGVGHGRVVVARTRAARLLQEGIRLGLTQPIDLAPEVRALLTERESEFLQEVARRVPTPTSRLASTKGPILPDRFPPCIRKMRRMLNSGENLSHAGRFALAAFLHRVGADAETIVDAYRGAPDFDESITRYQVEHITGHDEGRGYVPPECATLRTHGLCYRDGDPAAAAPEDQARDPRCFDESLARPIQYYLRRGGSVTDRGRPEAEGGSATPSARSGHGTPTGRGRSP
jgi:DNA primase large subunit